MKELWWMEATAFIGESIARSDNEETSDSRKPSLLLAWKDVFVFTSDSFYMTHHTSVSSAPCLLYNNHSLGHFVC